MSRSFKIGLGEIGDEGAEYHERRRNEIGQIQRQNVVDRNGRLVVQCDLSEVVHGQLSSDVNSSEPATVIIFDFRFLPTRQSCRFTNVDISVTFRDEKGRGWYDPEVRQIAPLGRFSLQPTTKKIELKRSGNASLSGGAVVPVGAGFACELTQSVSQTFEMRVVGMTTFAKGKASGRKNIARWSLLENTSQTSGVPSYLRTAVLLCRRPGDDEGSQFTASVEIDARVDFVSSLRNMFGSIPEDDPVIFDPREKPTTTEIDKEDLGNVKLSNKSAVVATTYLSTEGDPSVKNAKDTTDTVE